MDPAIPSPRRLDPVWTAPLLFVALGLSFAVLPLFKAATRPNCTGNKDYTIWYETGLATRAGIPLYEPLLHGEVKYMYPPTLAVLIFAPLTHLGPIGFVAVVGAITAHSWAACIWLAMLLVTGRWAGHPRWVYVVPGLAVGTYIWDVQLLGQVNLLLLALVLGSFFVLRKGNPISAGLLFGTAVAMKVFPLPALAYFIVRREWRAVAATGLAIAALVWFLPGVVRGFDATNRDLRQWSAAMIGDQTGETVAGRSSIGFTRRNQSLVSLAHRLLRPVDAGDQYGKPLLVNFADITPSQAQLIGYASCFGLGLVLLIAARFRFATSPVAEGLEVAMICTLVPLCSPLAWTYFFCWLLPAWVVVACLWNHPARSMRNTIRIGGVLAAILLASALSEQVDATLQALGVTAWGSMVLFLTLALARWQLPNESAAPSIAQPLRLAA